MGINFLKQPNKLRVKKYHIMNSTNYNYIEDINPVYSFDLIDQQ